MGFTAGTYSATYAPLGVDVADIGRTREGFRVREQMHHQDVITDDHGDAPCEGIQQGITYEVTLDWVEYDLIADVLRAQSPAGEAKTNAGLRLRDLAGQLVLTALTGTPAATMDGAGKSWIFDKAIVVTDIETLLASKLRQGPCTFRCYPDPANDDKAYRVDTTPT